MKPLFIEVGVDNGDQHRERLIGVVRLTEEDLVSVGERLGHRLPASSRRTVGMIRARLASA